MKRALPTWQSSSKNETDQLFIFNSLTRQKEIFKPLEGKHLKWYSCGPTVYDESHMGHARCFISFDILRRVLQDYFKFDITYCMNVTDIDDKIITRARKNFLYEEYLKETSSIEKIVENVKQAFILTEQKAQNEQDKDKKEMYNKIISKVKFVLDKFDKAPNKDEQLKKEILSASNEVLSTWLDKLKGKDVTDNSIFKTLPRHFEDEFHKDMAALNILPPNVLTRVSEYVPEIIGFIQEIIKNGFAYESNGSVYFDTIKFSNCENHYYAKLVPEAFGDTKALAEGEGDLTDQALEKRNPADFALWKFSKPGEPSWESPWGRGRPGWHIECSAMAAAIFGSNIDIHSGGTDLKFPHHDNEIAQSEAAFCNNNWVNFFLHSGHLHIQGCKMSKSLKNFITIKDALKKYSSRQIRILFLLYQWKDTLDYSDQAMESALCFEKTCKEFFFKIKDFSRNVKFNQANDFKKFGKNEKELLKLFNEKKSQIHKALCDSMNTPQVVKEILNLISSVNSYMNSNYNQELFNMSILCDIAIYITNLLKIFGVIESSELIGFTTSTNSQCQNQEEVLMPYLNVLSKFRDDIRTEARISKHSQILSICDKLRDDILPNLGVLIEDLTDRTVVKLCDREILLKEKMQKMLLAEQKKEEDLKKKQEMERIKKEKEAKKTIPPHEMFLSETDKFSKFDERGFPILDAEGKELSKGAKKKLEKLYENQTKTYQEYLEKKKNSESVPTI